MMNQEDRELVQAGVDGELDADGRARLDALLAGSAEARELREDLQRLADFVERVPPLEAPAGLHGRIVGGIELPKPGGVSRWFRVARLPDLARYGLAGAAAVVLTLAVYRAGDGLAPGAETDLVGTLASRGDMAGGREVDRWRFDSPEASGDVILVAKDDAYALAFELDLARPAKVAVVLPEGAYRFDAVAQQEEALASVAWAGNRLDAVADGERAFVVRLRRGSGAVTGASVIAMTISQDESAVFSGSLELPPP